MPMPYILKPQLAVIICASLPAHFTHFRQIGTVSQEARPPSPSHVERLTVQLIIIKLPIERDISHTNVVLGQCPKSYTSHRDEP